MATHSDAPRETGPQSSTCRADAGTSAFTGAMSGTGCCCRRPAPTSHRHAHQGDFLHGLRADPVTGGDGSRTCRSCGSRSSPGPRTGTRGDGAWTGECQSMISASNSIQSTLESRRDRAPVHIPLCGSGARADRCWIREGGLNPASRPLVCAAARTVRSRLRPRWQVGLRYADTGQKVMVSVVHLSRVMTTRKPRSSLRAPGKPVRRSADRTPPATS